MLSSPREQPHKLSCWRKWSSWKSSWHDWSVSSGEFSYLLDPIVKSIRGNTRWQIFHLKIDSMAVSLHCSKKLGIIARLKMISGNSYIKLMPGFQQFAFSCPDQIKFKFSAKIWLIFFYFIFSFLELWNFVSTRTWNSSVLQESA